MHALLTRVRRRLQRPARAEEDVNTRTAQLVKLISEIGPDIPEISRRLGQFKESVRYRYKTKLLDRGFAIQAMVDHEKIGMKRVVAIVDFSPEYRPYAESIITAMNELAYVVFFAQTLPEGLFVINASVPSEFVREFEDFLASLGRLGLFTIEKISEFEWFRNVPMKAEFYDFDSGLWDFDWSNLSSQASADASYAPGTKSKFDVTDLLLMKELQIDATRSMVEIASKLRINYKKLAWHYSTHVVARRLIKGYRLNWMGTRYDFKIERALHRQHRYILVALLATALTDNQRMEFMSRIHRLPFLWLEACGRSNYYAQLFLPVDVVNEALQFLQVTFLGLGKNLWYSTLDQAKALSYTFSYQLFDSENKVWKFEKNSLLNRFENLMLEIRKAG